MNGLNSINNSWIVNNAGLGVIGSSGEIIYSSIIDNADIGARNLDTLNYCNIYDNNGYDYEETRIRSGGETTDVRFNYWGEQTAAEMFADPYPGYITALHDGFDDPYTVYFANYGSDGEFYTEPVPNAPDDTPPGFLLSVVPDTAEPVNVEVAIFTLTFSKPMDTSVDPSITFGLEEAIHSTCYRADSRMG